MNSDRLILCEHESRVLGLRSLLTIGQRQPNGVRWGFNMDAKLPAAELSAFVCDANPETNTHGEGRLGYWGRYWCSAIAAQQAANGGHCYLDMSGWFGARTLNEMGTDEDYIKAVKDALGGTTLTAASIVWWNAEWGNAQERLWFADRVWRSGVFGDARLACSFIGPPRGIDGRTCIIEAQLPLGEIDDMNAGRVFARIVRDFLEAREHGLYTIAHIDAPDYDATGLPADAKRREWNGRIIAELQDTNAWLVFNPAGRINQPTQGTLADEVVQLRADSGAILAICGVNP